LALDQTSDMLTREQEYKAFEESWKEISTTCLMKHSNILRFQSVFVHHKRLWIVMPLMGMGSVRSALTDKFTTGFKDNKLLATVLRDLLMALAYLHRDGKIHKDIKAENILLAENGHIALVDFGCCVDTRLIESDIADEEDRAAAPSSPRSSTRNNSLTKAPTMAAVTAATNAPTKNGPTPRGPAMTFAGSPCWMAPEVMDGKDGIFSDFARPAANSSNWRLHHKADIWSFGITALELAFGRPPHSNMDPMHLRQQVLKEPPPTADHFRDASYRFSKHFHELVAVCLQKDPAARPSAVALLDHRFIRGYAESKSYVHKNLVRPLVQERARHVQPTTTTTKRPA